MSWRSLLFVPGHRIELLAKVPRWQPDAVIVDLEDAVAEPDKEAAARPWPSRTSPLPAALSSSG